MFKVLFPPFSPELGIDIMAHVAVVFQGKKKEKLLVQSTATSEEVRKTNVLWLQALCDDLNQWISFEFFRRTIESVKVVCQRNDAIKKRSLQKSSLGFRADFGRLDFGRPGQGGSGFDGYW